MYSSEALYGSEWDEVSAVMTGSGRDREVGEAVAEHLHNGRVLIDTTDAGWPDCSMEDARYIDTCAGA